MDNLYISVVAYLIIIVVLSTINETLALWFALLVLGSILTFNATKIFKGKD